MAAADPSLTLAQVTAAFDAAVASGAALRSLTVALADGPEVLHAGAPPVVGLLVGELVAQGSATFVSPACADCGREGWPLVRSGQGGVCARCRHHQLATACAQCGATRPVAGRTGAGEPVCETCRRRDRGQRLCGLCAKTAPIAVAGGHGRPDVCVNCYRLPEAVCGRCARRRPCNFVEDGRPICKPCAPRGTVRCARCGGDRPPSARWPEGPVCEACYRAALHRRGTCSDCKAVRRLVDPPGPEASRCADCAGVTVPGEHVCRDCGLEDRLFEGGVRWSV